MRSLKYEMRLLELESSNILILNVTIKIGGYEVSMYRLLFQEINYFDVIAVSSDFTMIVSIVGDPLFGARRNNRRISIVDRSNPL